MGESAARFKSYTNRLVQLLQDHEVRTLSALITAVRSNERFSAECRAIWSDIAEADGGKLSLSAAGIILGGVLGGVGIAAMGGAIGLPLVLGLGGLLAGTEFDALRSVSRNKLQLLRLPKSLHSRIHAAAEGPGISTSELIVRALELSRWSERPRAT